MEQNYFYIPVCRIQAAIPVAMPAFKEMSVLGLQYAVEQHKVLDVQVDVMPSQILIPENGIYRGYVLNVFSFYYQLLFFVLYIYRGFRTNVLLLFSRNENLLVVHLGGMTVTTASKDTLAMDVKNMHLHGRSEDDILQEMISRSYMKFTFKFEDAQVLEATKSCFLSLHSLPLFFPFSNPSS